MEENYQMPQEGMQPQERPPLTENPPPAAPLPDVQDAQAPVAPASGQEFAPNPQPDAEPTLSRATWDFGKLGQEPPKKKKEGKAAFFAVFGSVFAICLALLVLVLFLGEGGFQIIQTLYTERTVYVRQDDGTSGLLTPNEAADIVRKSTVTVVVTTALGTGHGSGFVYDAQGHICTNYHVIEDATNIQVLLPDGTAVDAQTVGYDALSDLAIIKVEAAGLVPATLGSSADLLVGDQVVAVGTPVGLELAGTATFGKISYVNRLIAVDDDGDGTYEKKLRLIQTDTNVNPGNSGGPVADMYGKVIGVVVRKMLNNEGLGFAIPIDGAKIVLDAIIQNGSFTGDNPLAEGRSLLGVTGHAGKKGMWYTTDSATGAVSSSPTEQAGYYYMPVDGVYVMKAEGAATGKLRQGDVILSINGLDVMSTQQLMEAVNRCSVGETVRLSVWRAGAPITVELILGEG